MSNRADDKTGEIAAEPQGSVKPTGLDNVKNIIADQLHYVAEALGERAADQGTQCGMAHYGKQASEWLDRSAGYVRQFDYELADARVRKYVGQSPGRSLLIAGAAGLILGVILRRR